MANPIEGPEVEGREGLLPAYDAQGVDLTLIRERLKMTPLERIQCVDEMNAFLEKVRPPGGRNSSLEHTGNR